MKRQPTPQHITWFLDMDRNGQLNLNPPYQRKSVWTARDRRFFLDTIFRNYPAPPIFVHRTINDSGFSTFHVVDGKQRLETILSFASNKLVIDKGFGDETLNGKKFKDLTTENKRKFWDYVLVVDFIDNIEGTNIEEVFDRVNRNSKNLQPQELRHARFDGWFIKEAETESEGRFWWDIKVSTRGKDKRMKNVQLISELLAITIEKRVVGFSQDYLDEMYAKYDSLDEVDLEFDLDAYLTDKEDTKAILVAMDAENSSIQQYCKTANNLYTLWAVVSLNLEIIKGLDDFAERFLNFMRQVDVYVQLERSNELPENVEDNDAYKFYTNSKGASTELPQRLSRLEALSSILA